MNDNEATADSSAESLAKAEQKLQLEQDKQMRESKLDAGVSTKPDVQAPKSGK